MIRNFLLFFLLVTLTTLLVTTSCTRDTSKMQTSENSEISDTASVAAPTPAPQMRVMMVHSPEGLRVRRSADINAEKIALLPDAKSVVVLEKGDEVTIDGIASCWMKIALPEQFAVNGETEGWVFGGYLVELSVAIKDLPGMSDENCRTPLAIGSFFIFDGTNPASLHNTQSEQAAQAGTLNPGDAGYIQTIGLAGREDDSVWYYLVNESGNCEGWYLNRGSKTFLKTTACGQKLADGITLYERKNATVTLARREGKFTTANHLHDVILSPADSTYAILTGSTLTVIDGTTNTVQKTIRLYNHFTVNEGEGFAFSHDGTKIYIAGEEAIYEYSLTDDSLSIVFAIDLEQEGFEGVAYRVYEIYPSPDDNLVFLQGDFDADYRWIPRIICYDKKLSRQRVLNIHAQNSDRAYYTRYSNISIDHETNETLFYAFYSDANADALVTVSGDDESWPMTSVTYLDDEITPFDISWIDGSNDAFYGSYRKAYHIDAHNPDGNIRSKYMINSYDNYTLWNDFIFSSGQKYSAVTFERGDTTGYAFYSMKTLNPVFTLSTDDIGKGSILFNDTTVLLIDTSCDDDYVSSCVTYSLAIEEKDNRFIADGDSPYWQEVCMDRKRNAYSDSEGYLCANIFFTNDGTYILTVTTGGESDDPMATVCGGYTIENDTLVLYPYQELYRDRYYGENKTKEELLRLFGDFDIDSVRHYSIKKYRRPYSEDEGWRLTSADRSHYFKE